MDKGDYAGAAKTFDPKLRRQLTDNKLKQGWQSVADKFGKRTSIGQPRSAQVNDVTIVVLPMQYKKATMGAQVACSKQGTVVVWQVGPMPGVAPASGEGKNPG